MEIKKISAQQPQEKVWVSVELEEKHNNRNIVVCFVSTAKDQNKKISPDFKLKFLPYDKTQLFLGGHSSEFLSLEVHEELINAAKAKAEEWVREQVMHKGNQCLAWNDALQTLHKISPKPKTVNEEYLKLKALAEELEQNNRYLKGDFEKGYNLVDLTLGFVCAEFKFTQQVEAQFGCFGAVTTEVVKSVYLQYQPECQDLRANHTLTFAGFVHYLKNNPTWELVRFHHNR